MGLNLEAYQAKVNFDRQIFPLKLDSDTVQQITVDAIQKLTELLPPVNKSCPLTFHSSNTIINEVVQSNGVDSKSQSSFMYDNLIEILLINPDLNNLQKIIFLKEVLAHAYTHELPGKEHEPGVPVYMNPYRRWLAREPLSSVAWLALDHDQSEQDCSLDILIQFFLENDNWQYATMISGPLLAVPPKKRTHLMQGKFLSLLKVWTKSALIQIGYAEWLGTDPEKPAAKDFIKHLGETERKLILTISSQNITTFEDIQKRAFPNPQLYPNFKPDLDNLFVAEFMEPYLAELSQKGRTEFLPTQDPVHIAYPA